MSTLDTTVNTMKRRLLRAEEPEWIVWLMIIAMLAIGLLTRGLVESRTDRFNADNITLRYPAAWSNLGIDSPYAVLNVGEGLEGGLFPTQVRVLKMPVTDLSTSAQTLGDLALKWSDKQVEELVAYRVLSVRAATIGKQDAIKVAYAYVADPILATSNSVPVVAQAEDVLIRQGSDVVIVSFAADATAYEQATPTWTQVLSTLDVK